MAFLNYRYVYLGYDEFAQLPHQIRDIRIVDSVTCTDFCLKALFVLFSYFAAVLQIHVCKSDIAQLLCEFVFGNVIIHLASSCAASLTS